MSISAQEIANALGKPPPTEQQIRVIESDPATPTLVIAGAGSGKTETMANRVLWLVANGMVRPADILGLTFTRKAAGELGERIGQRLDQLAERGLAPARSDDLLDQPTVSTYNSFASAIVSERSLLVGREPDSVIIDESTAWRLARGLVTASNDDRLVGIDRSINRITDTVLQLERSLRENVCTAEDVHRIATEFSGLLDLPISETGSKKTPYSSVVNAVNDVSALHPLVELAEAYSAEKRRRGFMEFSDQVALALEVCRRSPATVADYRARYRIVLLDEYQDTSVVQTWLLAQLFAGHSVMAVGDPHQSIYGWRGASADNLTLFSSQFADGGAQALNLSTSWRNSDRVLAVANALVTPLTQSSRVHVDALSPRPQAPQGTVESIYRETVEEEANEVAGWMVDQLAAGTDESPVSGAIICRSRSVMPLFADALTRHGVPNRILGLGGLLSSPEIIDIVSVLRTIWFTDAGSALIRLLTGPRWRVGIADVAALHAAARWLSAHDWRLAELSEEQKIAQRRSLEPEDSVSLIDALDSVVTATEGHPMLAEFSVAGLERVREAGGVLAAIRQRSGLGIAELVRLIEWELRLDTEVVAVSGFRRGGTDSHRATLSRARRNLDAFSDLVTHFLSVDDQGTLPSFLAWLDHAEQQDSLAARPEAADDNAVQLITAHGSKGLEWDVVAVPRLTDGDFPASSRTGTGWLRFGQLPDELKGDSGSLPQLNWRECATQKEFHDSLAEYKDAGKGHRRDEERRLIYVATTRARKALLLSGSFWAGAKTPRAPSPYLRELAEGGLIPALPESSEHDENPVDAHNAPHIWPGDPLGSRRPIVERAAELVAAASVDGTDTDHIPSDLREDLSLLLRERDRCGTRGMAIPLPQRITASRFKDFVTQPAEVARRMRRPLPQKPFTQTRLGTQFHAWVEERYATPGGTADTLDAELYELDTEPSETVPDEAASSGVHTTFDQLRANFEASEWGDRRPVEVEREIHLPFAGRTLVCKLDAVYGSTVDGEEHFEVVDWKTGRVPRTEQEKKERQLQLALYRIAYARWRGIDPVRVSVALYYVAANEIIRPDTFPSLDELEQLWRDAATGTGSPWLSS
ncbi:ATP-dependent DNA helicase [Klugiella xanthotipulae]|uniref:DNA 3'-5' helicase n=1 Tax=Klugiella xanthotipulae TaxID=244735 RepID=A0A543HRT4_9MICO|nr:ATP-dependent DNA helicase [Klugiella xanthotipulae]TQM61030.1 DNA helicase-2/ATP-dependent DNA helicase PcrA [Klugiella xanthotipulae]